jgi:hypothetical protein
VRTHAVIWFTRECVIDARWLKFLKCKDGWDAGYFAYPPWMPRGYYLGLVLLLEVEHHLDLGGPVQVTDFDRGKVRVDPASLPGRADAPRRQGMRMVVVIGHGLFPFSSPARGATWSRSFGSVRQTMTEEGAQNQRKSPI